MKLKHLKTIALSILVASNVFAATNTLHDKTEKTSPSVNDETYIWDVTDSTLKKSATGNLPISTATQTALDGKANASAFANQAAFTAAWGWTPGGGVSAWSDIQALLTGTGTYVKADGTTGDPSGTITTGDGVAAAMANALDGAGGLASKASLDALPNIVFGTGLSVADDTPSAGTDTVSIDADTTPTDGSAKPITSNAVFDALAGKETADSTIIKVAEIDTQAKFEVLTGWTLPSGGVGSVLSTLTDIPYSNVACTSSAYYSGYAYLCVDGFYTQKIATTTHNNPSPSNGISDNFSTDTSANYTAISGSVSIIGGAFHGGGAWAYNIAYNETSLGGSDHYVEGVITSSASTPDGGIIGVRCNGTTGYLLHIVKATSRAYLRSFNGATTSDIGSLVQLPPLTLDQYKIKLSISGSTIHAYIDLNNDGDYLDTSEDIGTWADSTYSSGNYAVIGVIRSDSGGDYTVDNFSGGSL